MNEFNGYVCCDCGLMSNNSDDFHISEEDVTCLRCRSDNIEPYDVEMGVDLI